MKKLALITGSCGLVGAGCVEIFSKRGFKIIGVDNDMRGKFFGPLGSTKKIKQYLKEKTDYIHYDLDIRNEKDIESLFREYKFDLIIHTAAQPSHDWAGEFPLVDFKINAYATLVILENFRKYAPEAVFIFASTNKVYGDRVNSLPFIEFETRFDLSPQHPLYEGIDEKMSIDTTLHSFFGVSKLSADILVQEYGKYFGLKTASFRCGCITGGYQAGVEAHGFLSYLVRCTLGGRRYIIYGYKGKQVRDNIHAFDLADAFYHFYLNPKCGEVYNMGGGRFSNISLLEAISLCEEICKKKLNVEYSNEARKGDHIWWISNNSKFINSYPSWRLTFKIERIMEDIFVFQRETI